MFAIIAAIAAAIGALEAFTSLSGISVLGLLCVAVACLALHLAGAWTAVPWARRA